MEHGYPMDQLPGAVFSIQHYCVHDGPGIRTLVFLKGCPLRCQWCANPESHWAVPQHMYRENLCTGCGACQGRCSAISRGPEGKAQVDFSQCRNCGTCAEVCPNGAQVMMGKTRTVREVFVEVQKDALFYGAEGGVTVSGGEPLTQPAFTRALLNLCREGGMTTALETTGCAPWETLRQVAEVTDTFLYDVKVMDPELHRKATGRDNRLILENLEKLSRLTSCRIIVRTPVIGGCNDTPENMRQMGRFLQERVPRCREVDLLPYHNLGEDKYRQLGRTDRNVPFFTPSEEAMEDFRQVLREYVETVK